LSTIISGFSANFRRWRLKEQPQRRLDYEKAWSFWAIFFRLLLYAGRFRSMQLRVLTGKQRIWFLLKSKKNDAKLHLVYTPSRKIWFPLKMGMQKN
jgi:hypothetical protein